MDTETQHSENLSLGSILEGEEHTSTDQEFAVSPDEPTGETQPEQEVPEAEAAPPAEEESPKQETPESVPYAVMRDERAKRQAVEAKLQQLQEFQQTLLTQQQAAQPAEAKPDPEAEFYADPVKFIQSQTESFQTQMQEQMVTQRVAMSAELARAQFDDYDQVIESFKDAANENPALWDQMKAQANPALYAYKYGKAQTAAKAYQEDPEALRRQMRAEILEELKKEGVTATAQAIPKTTASARNASAGEAPAAEDFSLDAIIGRIG